MKKMEEVKKRLSLSLYFMLFVVLTFFSSAKLSAQSKEVAAANQRTAERCLKLAENCLAGNDWKNALSNAELGLSYDESISDLIYIKALSQSNLNYPRAQILETIRGAFEKDKWLNYNKNGARILYADLLSEVGEYEQSMSILNEKPLIYNADSEFIRIKNYYRMGTYESISLARSRLSNARKIFPQDGRFAQIFFMFEMLYMNHSLLTEGTYEIPELVKTLASAYIIKLPDYDASDIGKSDTQIIALMFAQGEEQQRLLKAVGQINNNSPLYALAALRAGIISEENAYNLFFESSNNIYSLNILESFALLINNPGLRDNFRQRLNSFSGILYIDEDLDLRNELVIEYDRGRARNVKYDENNDQILEMNVICDFGTPVSIDYEKEDIFLEYDIFPSVHQINLNKKQSYFYFLNDDFNYNPFEMKKNELFSYFGADFYIPYPIEESKLPDETALAQKASSIELPTQERYDSKVIYTMFEGRPVFANFRVTERKYAYSTIETGLPFVRYVDYDGDNVFETAETFNFTQNDDYPDQYYDSLIKKIFGDNAFSKSIYLQKIEIDRNSDTIVEYKEEFLPKNGKISYWDDDGNGICDYQYIRYPDDDSNVLKEEAIFYTSNGLESVLIAFENEVPVLIRYNENEYKVIKGYRKNYYWISEIGTIEQEEKIIAQAGTNLVNGEVNIVQISEDERFTIIRVDSNFYLKKIEYNE